MINQLSLFQVSPAHSGFTLKKKMPSVITSILVGSQQQSEWPRAPSLHTPSVVPLSGWMGDDWFHHGRAFRELGLEYFAGQEGDRESNQKWWSDHFNDKTN